MADQEQQYDHIGAKYEDYARTATLKRAERYSFSQLVGDVTGKRVLDLACGTGFYTRWLKQHGAGQIMGVDISPEMIRIAAQQEKAEPLGITYQVSDAGNLTHLGTFDLITAVWLFNYVQTQDDTYDNLVDGGRLVSYTINPEFNFNKTVMAKYGINIKGETLEDGRYVIEGEYLTDPPMPVTVYRWNRSIYEWAVKEAGFKETTWQSSEAAPEDIEQFGKEYWQDYYDNCIGVGLIGQK
jgi:2-polyprenyl-3-methyl-5-hydroxy-6-metoxy-1,4-benzoquinol methylase